MKTACLWLLAAAVISTALSTCALGAPAPEDYFPPGTNKEDITWFGKCLAAADEPSLYQLSGKNHETEVYRLMITPPFTQAVILRLEAAKGGTGVLTLVRLNQESGPWTRKARFLLTKAGMGRFYSLMEQTHFWRLDKELKDEEVIEDGTEFVYEGVKNGRYHLVERVYPTKNTKFYAPAFYLLKLANEPTEGF